MASWINQSCPKIEINEEEKSENKDDKKEESLEIDLETINQKTKITAKNEFIKAKFFEIKKRLDEIDKKIDNSTKIKDKNRIKKHIKIRLTFDFTLVNIFITGVTLLIIFAFYKTGRKLLINSRFHND